MDELFEQRKKMIVELVHDELYVPMKIKELAIFLNVAKEDRHELERVLDSLVSEGKLTITKKGKYMKPDTSQITGVFESHPNGFGFVTIEGEPDDVFIPAKYTAGALHHDRVQIVITCEKSQGRRREGRVVKVLEHGADHLVGYYQKTKSYGFVRPDDQHFLKDIYIPAGCDMGAVNGHKVVVKITNYGDDTHKPEGKVIEILGHVNDPGTDIMSVIAAYDIPVEFPKEVMDSLSAIPDSVDSKASAGRVDFRNLQTVTIDGEDAKDLDDAISISKNKDGYTLGVHIADVSNYVTENSPLDKEAKSRGTSVYLVDRVIPMLPHKLSNGICSLNEGVDRLALSCVMDIDFKGNIVGHRICESVINVDRRMSYTSVKKILVDDDAEEKERYSDLVDMFFLMKELSELLRSRRENRGSIDFDFPESRIILDENGKPIDIKPYERNVATRIIEDFMLAANETVAEDFFWQELPFVYRTHDDPDPEKIRSLATFINNFGYSIRMGQDYVHPKELQKLLASIQDSPEEPLISRLTLRSMKRAQYSTECTGHFGLSAKYYCHFTSPIRRYPDLQIHRIIKENLHGGLTERRIEHYERILPEVAKNSSLMERRADDAERDTDKLKKVEYMSSRIGNMYDGVISGVTAYGFYVELPDTIEGMVHINTLEDDYYIFDETHYELYGEVTHKTYKLGQQVTVEVVGTDKLMRTIDFEVVQK